MEALKRFNLYLRVVMETGIVLGLGYWGYQTGATPLTKVLMCIAAPLVGFGFWGLVDFHQARHFGEPLRLLQELLISGLAALAVYVAGQPALGWALALVSVVHHALVYISGDRLLKRQGGY